MSKKMKKLPWKAVRLKEECGNYGLQPETGCDAAGSLEPDSYMMDKIGLQLIQIKNLQGFLESYRLEELGQ